MTAFLAEIGADFWAKVIGCCVLIVIALPVLIFVKKKERSVEKSLAKRFDAIDRQLLKVQKDGDIARREMLNLTKSLNALYKISQQAAYEYDNYGFDKVKAAVGDALEPLDWKILKHGQAELYRSLMPGIREKVANAKTCFDRAMESRDMILGK